MTLITDYSVPNRSEFAVPNRSELKSGRPAIATNEALLVIARRMSTSLSRMPRADELIAEAGGCQRSRALDAIRTVRLEQAQGAVSRELIFAPEIERSLRQLMAQWHEQAAAQLAQAHAEHGEQYEKRESAQLAFIGELEARTARLSAQIDSGDSQIVELTEKMKLLNGEHTALHEQYLVMRALAAERLRTIRANAAQYPTQSSRVIERHDSTYSDPIPLPTPGDNHEQRHSSSGRLAEADSTHADPAGDCRCC